MRAKALFCSLQRAYSTRQHYRSIKVTVVKSLAALPYLCEKRYHSFMDQMEKAVEALQDKIRLTADCL